MEKWQDIYSWCPATLLLTPHAQLGSKTLHMIWEIINQKIQGQEIIAVPDTVQVNVIDIMEALKQSLAKVKNDG